MTCNECKYLDECPEEWFNNAGGYCEDFEPHPEPVVIRTPSIWLE